MKIGTIKETKAGENRVALSPDVVKNFVKQGFECIIESGAGIPSNFSDEIYTAAGASVVSGSKEVYDKAATTYAPKKPFAPVTTIMLKLK